MTPYRDRREAGEYDAPGSKPKTKEERRAQSTTSADLSGTTGTKPKNGRKTRSKGNT